MSRRRAIVGHIGSLHDLQDIVTVMKRLAMIEVAKFSRTHDARRQVIAMLDTELARFIAANPAPVPTGVAFNVEIAIGSERGFCGDFNDRVAERLLTLEPDQTTDSHDRYCIGVGTRLADRLPPGRLDVSIAGASVAEEIERVLVCVLRELTSAEQHAGERGIRVRAISHRAEGIAVLPITPSMERTRTNSALSYAAMVADLQLPPAIVLEGLFHAYLEAALTEVISASLEAENCARLERMESALQHIDERIIEMRRTVQRLRQEEITNEIEVIELSYG